jgi:DNA-binding NarL/FixJ family response regulator
MTSERIKIAIIDDQILFRKSLATILSYQKNLEILLEETSGTAFFKYLELGGTEPDVLLLDLHLPDINGMEITRRLRQNPTNPIKIIILSAHSQERYAGHLLELGAHSYLNKDCEPQEVVKAIYEVHERGFYFNAETKKALTQHHSITPDLQNPALLTEREKEIVIAICHEMTNKEISERLNISIKTIESHRANIAQKIGTKSVAGIILYAVRAGWVIL